MKGVNSNPFVVIHFNIVIPINNVAIAHFEAENTRNSVLIVNILKSGRKNSNIEICFYVMI